MAGCTYTQKIKDGNTAYQQKQFAIATKFLKTEFNKSKSSSEKSQKAFMLGDSYKRLNQPENSAKWFMEAYNRGHGPDALKEYAYALKEQESYEEAAKAFEDLIVETGEPFIWQKEVAACRTAKSWKEAAAKNEYKIKSLEFNSANSDFAPAIYKDNQLVFSTDRTTSTGEEIYNWTGNDFMDLFVVGLDGGVPQNFSELLNSPYNEGTVTFNEDFSVIYFSRCGSGDKAVDDYCKLMVSRLENGQWSKPEVLSFVEDNVNYAHPLLTPDGKTIYFSTDHSDGYGGFDIYYSELTDEGWSLPENLGSRINTEGNEVYPFLDADTLYFSSDYHVGMGGMDIFKTYRGKGGRWAPLYNLKAPLNSGADDFGYVIKPLTEEEVKDSILQIGFFTSNRTGKGNEDIYEFKKVLLPPPPVVVPEVEEDTVEQVATTEPDAETAKEETYRYILVLTTFEKTFNQVDDPTSGVSGRRNVAGAKIQINGGSSPTTLTTDANGQIELDIELGKYYNFFGTKSGYLNNSTNFSSQNITKDPNRKIRKFRVELELFKDIRKKEITLENIYYNYNKWDIRPDAEPTLIELARLLRENPTIKIQLSSHTDCRGNDGYNQWLSQKRAESAVQYLTKLGIGFERLSPQGYGESRLAVTCACSSCSDAQHQTNRRTTFTILE